MPKEQKRKAGQSSAELEAIVRGTQSKKVIKSEVDVSADHITNPDPHLPPNSKVAPSMK